MINPASVDLDPFTIDFPVPSADRKSLTLESVSIAVHLRVSAGNDVAYRTAVAAVKLALEKIMSLPMGEINKRLTQ